MVQGKNIDLSKVIIWLSSLVILALSVKLAFEKVLYVDNAYILFNLINKQTFEIAHHRYIMYFFQLLPYLGVKIGMNVSMLIYLYSINLYLVYIVAAFICFYLLNDIKAALGICLTMFGGIASNFFFTTEILHGIVVCFLLFAFLKKHFDELNPLKYFILFLLLFLNVFGHPISLITTTFTLGYFFVTENKILKRESIIIASVFIVLILFKKLLLPQNTYEQGFYDELKNSKTLLLNFFNLYSTKYFFTNYSIYIPVHILLLSESIFLIIKKKYKVLCLFLITSLIYFILTCIIFNKGDTAGMMERIFLPLIFFAVIIFMYEVWESTLIFQLAVVIFVLNGMKNVYDVKPYYTERITFIDNTYNKIKNLPGQKFYSYTSAIPNGPFIHYWSLAVEMLLYSATKNKSEPKTVYFFDGDKLTEDVNVKDEDLFLCVSFWPYWSVKNQLNFDYFPIRPQTYHYVELNPLNENIPIYH